MLKKILLVLCCSLLFAALATAAPFLVCDPQTNVTSYMITLDGSEAQEVPAQDLGDNTTRLHYDLAGLLDGNHTGTVASKNVWGESEPVPFCTVIFYSMPPAGVRIEKGVN